MLTGGCRQNRLLSEMNRARHLAEGIEPLLHRRVPPNDGGLAVGQVIVAAASLLARGEGTHTGFRGGDFVAPRGGAG